MADWLIYRNDQWINDRGQDDMWKSEQSGYDDWTLPEQCKSCQALQIDKSKFSEQYYYRCMFKIDMQKCKGAVDMIERKGREKHLFETAMAACRQCEHCRRERNTDGSREGVCLSNRRYEEMKKSGLPGNLQMCSQVSLACQWSILLSDYLEIKEEKEKEVGMEYVTEETMSEKLKETIGKIDAKREMETMLTDYPLKSEWKSLWEELKYVYDKRVEHWSQIKAEHGYILRATGEIEERDIEALEAAYKLVESPLFTLGVKKEFRKKVEGMGSWRLNMHPGALISAAQKGGSLGTACACLGANEIYEGTAAQVAFDPHVAVLEPIDESTRKKKDGFQFVVLDNTGMHAYGGCYTGSEISNEKARELARKLAEELVGKIDKENREKQNEAVEKFYKIVTSTSECLMPKKSFMKSTTENRFNLEIDSGDSTKYSYWSPIEHIEKAYEDAVIDAAFFEAGQGIAYDLYDYTEISEMIRESGIIEKKATCDHCGDWEPEEEMLSGYEYGLGDDSLYCCVHCLRRAMEDEADQRIENVVLINGEMYELPC